MEVFTLSRARSNSFVNAVNIRPGGFEDRPSAAFEPQPSPYAAKDLGRTLGKTMRSLFRDQAPGVGDVKKIVLPLLALADSPRDQLPGAVVLGCDAYSVTRAVAMKRVAHIQHNQRVLQNLMNSASPSQNRHVWFGECTCSLALYFQLMPT